MGKTYYKLILLAIIVIIGYLWYKGQLPTRHNVGMPNPASVYCIEQGGKSVIADCRAVGTRSEGWYNHLTNELIDWGICGEEGGQTGFCFLPDGRKCLEWDFYNLHECILRP